MVDRLLAYFEPWMTDDLRTYLTVVGEAFEQAEAVYLWDPATLDAAGLDPDEPDEDVSYGQLLDPDVTSGIALPWLAQFVGERFPVGIDEAARREWILDRPNSRRGTMVSIAAAAQRSLVGSRTVMILERNDGVTQTDAPDDVAVFAYADECPDPARVRRDLQDTFPLELSLNFIVNPGTSWQQIVAQTKTWGGLVTANSVWDTLVSGKAGGIFFGK
jgi:hypothetical protein